MRGIFSIHPRDCRALRNNVTSLDPSPSAPLHEPSLTLGPSPEGRGKHDAAFSLREKGWG